MPSDKHSSRPSMATYFLFMVMLVLLRNVQEGFDWNEVQTTSLSGHLVPIIRDIFPRLRFAKVQHYFSLRTNAVEF